jgi:hypothetical protein
MSAYKGHRGPNVSQYIANLNQLSPPQESLNTLPPAEEDFSAFLNTDFFDINNGPAVDLNSPVDLDLDFAAEQSAQSDLGDRSRKHSVVPSVEPNMDFNLNGKQYLCLLHSYLHLCAIVLDTTSVYCLRPVVQWALGAGTCRTPPCASPATITPTHRTAATHGMGWAVAS